MSSHYFLTCPKYMEEILQKEAKDITGTEGEISKGGLSIELDDFNAIKLLLNTRIASRVLKQIDAFEFSNKDDLYKKGLKIKWTSIFSIDQTFKILTIFDPAAKEEFKNSMYISQTLKDSIVDCFRNEKNQRPNVDTKNPHVTFYQRVETIGKNKYKAIISIDLSGEEALSNRGYRSKTTEAPLRENLAAAIIMSMDWDKKAPLIDLMCGSGTFLIEAALIKGEIPPTYLKIREHIETNRRNFAFMHHNWFKRETSLKRNVKDLINKMYKDIIGNSQKLTGHQIVGHDFKSGVLRKTKENIESAKMIHAIKIERADATKVKPVFSSGIVICNPPYGERLGEEEELEKLYYELGENLKENFKNFKAYIFTSNPELRKKISLKTTKRITFYNGKLDCRLLEYDLY